MREDWIECTLGEICDFIGGGTPSKSKSDYWNGEIPWASIKDIKGDVLLKTKDFITEKGLKNSATNLAYENEIILATRINPGKPILTKIRTSINQDLKIVRPKIKIDTKYFFWLLKTLESDVLKLSSGTTVLGINLTNLKTISFGLAPLVIQRAIVAKLEELFSSLDSGIADLKKAQAQLVIYRQAVLKRAFEGELTKEWRGKQIGLPSADELLKQIKEERQKHYEKQLLDWKKEIELWEKNDTKDKKPTKPRPLTIPDPPNARHDERKWNIPKNWIWTQIGEVCFVTKLAGFEYTDHVNYEEKGDLPVLKAENVGPLGFRKTEYSKVKSESVTSLTRSQIFGGELLIVFVGAGTGNIAMVPLNQRYFLGPNIGMARPYFDLNSKYLELFLQSAFGKSLMMSAVKAVAQPSLSMGTIRQAPVAFPSLKEQHVIVREIESRLSVCDKVEQSIKESLIKAEALRQSILKKAFEGKLLSEEELAKCKADKDYEPADVLLKRIKAEKKKNKATIAKYALVEI